MSVPVDRSRAYDEDDYPRSPSEYVPDEHFVDRFTDAERFLDRELDDMTVVERILQDGEKRDNGDGCCCFVLDWHGVRYFLIAGFHEVHGYRILVTGWPLVYDRQRAINSDHWHQHQIRMIEQFNEHYERNKQSA